MNIPNIKSYLAPRAPFGALLLVAFALVIFAGFTENAQAQGEINDIGVTAGNLVLNSSFETAGTGGLPDQWAGIGLGLKDKRVCNESYNGSCSFKLFPDLNNKWLEHCQAFSDTDAGDQFKLKVWTKGKSVVLGGGYISALVQFYDAGSFISAGFIYVPAGNSPWTLRQVNATAAADYDQVCIYLQTNGASSGKVWFDKLALIKLP